MERQEAEYHQAAAMAAAAAEESRFRRICVFCGSSAGKNPSYQTAAIELGKELVIEFFLFFELFMKLNNI